jgi:hypothetical protein
LLFHITLVFFFSGRTTEMQSVGGRKFDLEEGASLASAENQKQVAGDQVGTTMDNLQVEDLYRPATHDGDDMENQVEDPTGSNPTSPVKKKVVLSTTSRTKANPTIKKVL